MSSRTKRRPRDQFLPKLARIVSGIEASPIRSLSWRWPAFLGGGTAEGTIVIEALYAFGSFARGAAECGDLDLLLSFAQVEGEMATELAVQRSALRRTRDVDLIVVHADGLSARLERFPEATLLWSTEQRDWRARVAAIPVRPEVGRFLRPTDELPLALEQFNFFRLESAQEVVASIAAHELTSTWVPLDQIVPEPESWDPELRRIGKILGPDFGKKTRELLPFVLQWMSQRLVAPARIRWPSDRACVHVNEMHAHLGHPRLTVALLSRANVGAVVLAPQRTKRFSEGLWILERGENHPLVAAFEPLQAWIEAADGEPVVCIHIASEFARGVTSIELFASRRGAEAFIAGIDDQTLAERAPQRVEGHRLLDLICTLERLVVKNAELQVTGDGFALAEQLGTLLKRRTRARGR